MDFVAAANGNTHAAPNVEAVALDAIDNAPVDGINAALDQRIQLGILRQCFELGIILEERGAGQEDDLLCGLLS